MRMRTTVRLDDHLLAEAKHVAAKRGETLTAVIEYALRAFLRRGSEPTPGQPPRLTTFRGRCLQPGVDLDGTAALLDLMERPHGSRRR
jgi:hypothetical protein